MGTFSSIERGAERYLSVSSVNRNIPPGCTAHPGGSLPMIANFQEDSDGLQRGSDCIIDVWNTRKFLASLTRTLS